MDCCLLQGPFFCLRHRPFSFSSSSVFLEWVKKIFCNMGLFHGLTGGHHTLIFQDGFSVRRIQYFFQNFGSFYWSWWQVILCPLHCLMCSPYSFKWHTSFCFFCTINLLLCLKVFIPPALFFFIFSSCLSLIFGVDVLGWLAAANSLSFSRKLCW